MIDSDENYKELCVTALDLLISLGLLGSVMQNYPEDVQENFEARLVSYRSWMERQIEEVRSFAETWDDH